MLREEKTAVVDELAARFGETTAIFAVEYRGISVPQAAELRSKLRESDASFTVVKNRLAKLAAEKAGTEGLDELLSGPIALTLIKGDAVTAAKTISDFIKENEILVYRGGMMDGEALDPDGFLAISRLPGVDVLHGRLVGMIASPLNGLVTGLNNLISGLGRQLAQIAEQGLVTGEAPAPAAEEAPAEEAPAEETPAEEAPAEEAPAAEESPAEDAPAAEETPAEEAPVEEPSTDEPPVEEPPSEDAPEPAAEEAPADEAPAEETETSEDPAEAEADEKSEDETPEED